MSDERRYEMKVFVELKKLLTPSTIAKLQNAIEVPARIVQDTGNDPIKFLFALKKWDQFNPSTFDLALQGVGGSILHTARKLEWLSDPSHRQRSHKEEPKSMQTFVQLLTQGMTSQQWMLLANTDSESAPKSMLKQCIDNRAITSNMVDLCEDLEIVERNDLAIQVRGYITTFQHLSSNTFRQQILEEIERDEKAELIVWQLSLREFIRIQNKDVSVILDQDPVPIESVYIPLTVIKVESPEKRVGAESGCEEIEFLRNIHSKVAQETVEVVDFDSIVTSFDSSRHELWCLIGSPGSGKSFLCKHFAYMYGTNTLTNFRYVISIPCRSPEWHKLEEARHEAGNIVDSDFIVCWLSLSMFSGAKWSNSLSEQLVKSDGEGLLIILDGADEFARDVPFDATLLNCLLKRRILPLSTVLVTSRPYAWSELQEKSQFHVDAHFQVLGFSPENRDLYFKKRIETISKLNDVNEMFYRHEEIEQLSLIPVNASLFTALFNESESILTFTLSHIYTQLIVYMIRRQLSRMGLKEHSKVCDLSKFHPGIQKCIRAIGKEANQGIFDRDLTSDKNIPLKIGDTKLSSERLGLMQAHVKVGRFGNRMKVWTFQHLTIQEFMAAVSICANSWTNQCLIFRYITSSVQYLSMYKMVIRFVSGILRQNAGRMTPILCRHTLPKPMSFSDVPIIYKLGYFFELINSSGWKEFTQSFLLLCALISEINYSDSISKHFAYFKEKFPEPTCLYFTHTVSPNEWHCFTQSLKYVHNFHVIFINSGFIKSTQFNSLLPALSSCHLDYLSLVFVEKDFETILSFTGPLSSATLPASTRISINIHLCDLTACNDSQLLFPSTNQFTGSLKLYESAMKHSMLENLTNQFRSLHNLFYSPKSNDSDWSLIHQLISDSPLNGLYIDDFHGFLPVTADSLSALSSLKELYWETEQDCYEALQYLHRLSSITYLRLSSASWPSPNPSYPDSISRLISENATSLREISLIALDRIGFDSWGSCLDLVSICSNLISLQLIYCNFTPDDMSCWYRALTVMKSLVYLKLEYTPLQDSGMLILCHSLNYHPAIRYLLINRCELSSKSCLPIKYLILTPPHIKILDLSKSELSSPDPEQLELLEQSAEQCSIKIRWVD